MVSGQVRVAPQEGLHARPAAEFVRVASRQGHQVRIARSDGKSANGASILEVLTLGLKQGEQATITVTGSDEETLLADLIALLG